MKFIKLSEQRMTRIYQTANLIANLSNTTNYTYSKEEINELFSVYFEQGEKIKDFFSNNTYQPANEKLNFKFSVSNIGGNKKNQKFRKLAEQRLNKILQNLILISRLSNRRNYKYSTEEIDYLFSCYMEKGEEIKRFFEPHLEPLNDNFSYDNFKI
ncbi:hypothetical protein [Senegalia massiliensis]|uniref:hypothetical protein n=1 Tax=Senegalia massiliensis TaxID=1720316 RepID=UPI001362654B|nr:hypothetical protein [Senegalia massiliensis]